jgi:hypothetical protein
LTFSDRVSCHVCEYYVNYYVRLCHALVTSGLVGTM